MSKNSLLRILAVAVASFLYTACTPSTPATVHVGPVSQTGTLVSTGVSLIRRGTHVLQVNGKSIYYLESKNEDLEAFNNQRVFVEGKSEANTYPRYLPVIVVSHIRALDSSTTTHTWKIPAMNVSIITPDDWVGSIEKNTVTFRLRSSNDVILTIIQKNDTSTLPQGTLIRIAGQAGVQIKRENNAQDIYLPNGNNIISLHFTPPNPTSPALLNAFNTVLSTLSLAPDSSSTSSDQSTTDSGSTIPCGGPAGVLCPSGFYCDIQDTKLNIGKCMR